MASQKERMLAGELYIADDPEIREDLQWAAALLEEFNACRAADGITRMALLRELLGAIGEGSEIRSPLYCEYGKQIKIGRRTFINFGAMLLDVAPITIGDDCQIGPNVQLLTPTHPLEPEQRRQKWESAEAIVVGNNVWLGGGVIVCPGVTIGDNSVVGAGSVVIEDLPANVLAVGNPARVVRKL